MAGVTLALFIPLRANHASSPLHSLEHALAPWVGFLIVPLFGLANAGVPLFGMSLASLAAPIPLGTAAGLFIGKQLGVFAVSWAAIRLRIADKPARASWTQLYGVSLLCGVGFTMSLFIAALAFPDSPAFVEAAKTGTIAGSLLSALAGFLILRFAPGTPPVEADRDQADDIFSTESPSRPLVRAWTIFTSSTAAFIVKTSRSKTLPPKSAHRSMSIRPPRWCAMRGCCAKRWAGSTIR